MKLALIIQLGLCLLFFVCDGTEFEKRTAQQKAEVKAYIAEVMSDMTANQMSLTEAFSMMHDNTNGIVSSDDIRQAITKKFGLEPNMELCTEILFKIDPTKYGYWVDYKVFFEAIA